MGRVGDLLSIENPLQFNLDNYVGGTFRGKPIFDLDGVEDQIDSGRSQKVTANGKITYTFLDEGDGLIGIYNNKNYGFTAGEGLAAFSAAQEAEARDSITLWDDLVAPEFVETEGRGADIQFANSTDPAQAYAYYPSEKGGQKYLGDVFVADPAVNWTNAWLGYGGYGATTLVHELGHALGLSHPGNYNYDPDLPLSYANYAEYAQDSEQYTIMSYWSAQETGARIVNWDLLQFNNPQTPLLHDIYVIQEKYGADPTTRTGDTTYGFNSTADREVYDFDANPFPYLSIYDAGGEDTLDFSGFFGGTVLNLNDGEFSSGGSAIPSAAEINANALELYYETGEVDYIGGVDQATIDSISSRYISNNARDISIDTGYTGVNAVNYENISIAYGTMIENAVGSEYRDIIIANELDNTLTGNGGADVFVFQDGGTDTITDFLAGEDLIDLSALAGEDTAIDFGAGFLEADFDGDGAVDLTLVFDNGAELTAADVYMG
ncbi:hypothetical protein A9D14_16095 (plasmid) [Croceicoccus marinus]|uniref:Peptidase metallopeptidase domain-containing protein n=1 Tax=Croceicoccus marinus TaxID=450378 RepID=A0A1Z1FGJ6_9SPHN|nr:hypothetical protein A9D14_16095 [Croceicoccus marinus]